MITMTSRAMIDCYGSLDCFIDGRDIDSISSVSPQPRVATEAKPAGSGNAAHVNAAGRQEAGFVIRMAVRE